MKNIFSHFLTFCLLAIVTSCGISEDCFKGNGTQITQSFPLENFTKIKVYDGVGLIVKEGPNYEVKIKTSDKIIDDIAVRIEGDMLVIKDNSTCNIARNYGQTTVYVTAPNIIELHSKTDQDIKSNGVLHYPILRLFSMDLSDGAGTGDFYIQIENTSQIVIESNNVSNYYISGNTSEMILNFYFGNGRFYGQNLDATTVNIFHRGSNDMIVRPIQKIQGVICATGNVILKNIPPEILVDELFTGKLIYN